MSKPKLVKKKDYIPYPDLEDENFHKIIVQKKEFGKTKIPKLEGKIDDLCSKDKPFNLLPQQEFLKNYISDETPYNGILVIHGTGTGKTCAAISIAEGFKQMIKKYNNKILIIVSKNIKENFKKEIFNIEKELSKKTPDLKVQCTGYSYGEPLLDKNLTKAQKVRKIKKLISSNYEFLGYNQFANEVQRLLNWKSGKESDLTETMKKQLTKLFSNRIIIIDEVHSIKLDSSVESKNVTSVINSVIKYGKNNRLVLMSATPMYNQPQEIIYLLNLLLQNDNRKTIKISDVFDGSGNMKKSGDELLKEISTGYISYLRGQDPIRFPLKIYPKDAKTPIIKYDIFGKKLPEDKRLKYIKLVECPVSEFHYKELNKLVNKNVKNLQNNTETNTEYETNTETNTENEYETENELNKNSLEAVSNQLEKDIKQDEYKFQLLQNATQMGIIGLPQKKGTFTYGRNGFENLATGKGAFIKNLKKDILTKTNSEFYSYEKHCLKNPGTKNEKPFLDESLIDYYSSKLKRILEEAKDCKGKLLISSNFLYGGLIPIALALEQNGFLRFTIRGERQFLDYKPNKSGGGGKSEPIDYLTGLPASKSKKDEFKPAKYVLLTGDSKLQKITPADALSIFNNDNNRYGEKIKIILGSRVISEGLDFKGIRQIHIVEPWFNISRLNQTIGRGIRNCSHISLKPEERNVEVFQYTIAAPKKSNKKDKETETIDERNYRLSEFKDIRIQKVEYLLKQNAIDCYLNKEGNFFNLDKDAVMITPRGEKIKVSLSDKPYSRECHYMEKCDFTCNYEPKNNKEVGTDITTYSDYFARSDIEKIIEIIKKLFRRNYIYSLEDIVINIKEILPNIEDIYIYIALSDLINSKQNILYDKFGRQGYLIFKGGYYLFQPTEFNNKSVPVYYRSKPLKIKPTGVNINKNLELEQIKNINKNKISTDKGKKIFEKIIKDFNTNKKQIIDFEKVNNLNNIFEYYFNLKLDNLNSNDISQLLVYLLIENQNQNKNKNKNINEILKIFYSYLEKYLFFENRHLLYDLSKDKGKVIGFKINDKYYCIENNTVTLCQQDKIAKIKFNEKLIKKKTKNKNIIYYKIFGYISDIKKNNIITKKFKIVDKTKEKQATTFENKKSKRSIVTGRVCSTFKKEDIKYVIDNLKIKFPLEIKNKGRLCFFIELYMRSKKKIDNKQLFMFDN